MSNLESLSPELILRILSHVKESKDVCKFRQTCNRFNKLGKDNLLWQRLYSETFLLNKVEFKRQKSLQINKIVNHDVDWLQMFKIAFNWVNGRFSTHELQTKLQYNDEIPQTIVESIDDFIFVAKDNTISVYSSIKDSDIENNYRQDPIEIFNVLKKEINGKSTYISAMAIDRQINNLDEFVRILITLNDERMMLLCFDYKTKTLRHLETFTNEKGYIKLVILYGNHFATCTLDFRIQIYSLENSNNIEKISDCQSLSCYWPACIRFEKDEKDFNFCIAYSIPIYPQGWTIGLQRLTIKNNQIIKSKRLIAKNTYINATLNDKIAKNLTNLQYNDSIIVVSFNNEIYCFKIENNFSIYQIKTFYGHTGSINSIFIDSDKCISASNDGSIRIWKLKNQDSLIAHFTGIKTRLNKNQKEFQMIFKAPERLERKKRKFDEIELKLFDIIEQSKDFNNESFLKISYSQKIQWVECSFDKIISISTIENSNQSSLCRLEAAKKIQEEFIQIWNFASM